MKKLRMGVLGLGEGRSVISAVRSSAFWEPGAVCDLNEDLCRERCAEFHLPGYTTDYNEMLKDPDIDVIGIYTPDSLHSVHALAALESGKHVVCTKPLMTDLSMARTLLEAQRKSGKLLMVGQSSRYFEAAMHQRRDFEKGRNGELVSVETHYNSDSRWFLDRPWSLEAGFSWMGNFLIHAIDLAVWYLPRVEEVYGVGICSANSRARGVTAPDSLKFLLRDENGLCASVTGNYAVPAFGEEAEHFIGCTLRGTAGSSRADCPFDYYHHFSEPGIFSTTVHENYAERYDYYYRFGSRSHHAGEYQNYLDYFARCLECGVTPMPDLKEGIRTIAVMEAMNRSLSSGLPEKVSRVLRDYDLKEVTDP